MNIQMKDPKTIQKVTLTDCINGLDEFMAVVRFRAELEFSPEFCDNINRNRALIDRFLAENRAVYGVTTGFGENVRYAIPPEDAQQLQKNIVRSHACAVGEPLSEEKARAVMLMTILNADKAHSGIRLETLELIRQLLNRNIIPYAPCEGSVGYLGVEAHLVHAYIGEGTVLKDGRRLSAAEVLKENGLEPLTAYAAKDLEADVKLVYTREEQIVNTMMKHSFDAKLESKVDESGKLMGMSIFCETDSGAYLTISEGYLEHISHKMNTVYPIPNFRFAGRTVCTNTPINGSFRSWGTSEMTLLMEDHLNKMCQRFGLDPIEFRLNNTYDPYERDQLQGISLGNARFKDCLTRGRERFGWDERKKWCQARNAGQDRYRCGVGMAMTSHTSSFYPRRVDIATANVRVQEDGSLIVTVGIHDHGCGTVLAMKKIAAEIFQIDLDRITLEEPDTQVSRYDYGCYSSRTVYTLGMAVKLSCEHLLEKAEEIAGAIFGCNVCLIRYENGEFFKETEPEKRISMRQVARHGIQVLGNDLNYAHTSLANMNPAVPAAHFTQVEVDTYTGMVRIMHCLSVHDIGKAINPALCRGQVGSGIQQGIGQALREEILIHPKTGETLTPNLKSYENMNAWDMPDYDVLFIEEPEESGPFNAKSIGEVVLPPVAPAVAAAVNDALGAVSPTPLIYDPAELLEDGAINPDKSLAFARCLRTDIAQIRMNRKKPSKLKFTPAEQQYKERAVRGLLCDLAALIDQR